jgi:hypothetical protein
MTGDFIDGGGFGSPSRPRQSAQRNALALIASVALAISTVVAVTVVSIEIARAEIPGAADSDSPLSIALFLGVVLTGMGGLAVLSTLHSMRKPRRD